MLLSLPSIVQMRKSGKIDETAMDARSASCGHNRLGFACELKQGARSLVLSLLLEAECAHGHLDVGRGMMRGRSESRVRGREGQGLVRGRSGRGCGE